LDPALAHHAPRCDIGFVALYATGNEAEGYARGAVRFLNVMERPPFRGRPVLESTHSLSEVVEEIVARAMDRAHIEWADPEPEPDG
jgi:hypothetical protein